MSVTVSADLKKWVREGTIRTSAVCLDVRLREPIATDAICIAVEHVAAGGIISPDEVG